jgi:hypothetical protein
MQEPLINSKSRNASQALLGIEFGAQKVRGSRCSSDKPLTYYTIKYKNEVSETSDNFDPTPLNHGNPNMLKSSS